MFHLADNVYVVGHKSPDTDSVAAAISYANLKNKLNLPEIYVPAAAGTINSETKFVLDHFGVPVPETITGTCSPVSSISSSRAKIAALAFSVSKIVSTRNRSAPPSSNPSACSR